MIKTEMQSFDFEVFAVLRIISTWTRARLQKF